MRYLEAGAKPAPATPQELARDHQEPTRTLEVL